jgi:hypothetical protein
MTGLPKNLFNKIKQMIFQYTSTQRSDIAALQAAVSTPKKEYFARVAQSGSIAPSPVVVIKNTLGFTPTFGYSTNGQYTLNDTNAYVGATFNIVSANITNATFLSIKQFNNSIIEIGCKDNLGVDIDSLLDCYISITLP